MPYKIVLDSLTATAYDRDSVAVTCVSSFGFELEKEEVGDHFKISLHGISTSRKDIPYRVPISKDDLADALYHFVEFLREGMYIAHTKDDCIYIVSFMDKDSYDLSNTDAEGVLQ